MIDEGEFLCVYFYAYDSSRSLVGCNRKVTVDGT